MHVYYNTVILTPFVKYLIECAQRFTGTIVIRYVLVKRLESRQVKDLNMIAKTDNMCITQQYSLITGETIKPIN